MTFFNSLLGIGMLVLILILINLAVLILEITYKVYMENMVIKRQDIIRRLKKDFSIYLGLGILSLGVILLPIVLRKFGFNNLVNQDVLETFSSTAIVTMIISTVIVKGSNAFTILKKLGIKKD